MGSRGPTAARLVLLGGILRGAAGFVSRTGLTMGA
ncbi:hypothetical protein JMJ77_0012839, partial [Colletotrichum scovillei]